MNCTLNWLQTAPANAPERNSRIEISFLLVNINGLILISQNHAESVPICKNLKNRNLMEIGRIVILSSMIIAALYNLVGAYGYLTFGPAVKTDFLTNYEDMDAIMILGMAMIAAKYILAYPIMLFCQR